MTDTRHSDHNYNQPYAYRKHEPAGTSVVGILVALALIAAILFGLSFLFSGTTSQNGVNNPAAVEQTTPAPATPAPAQATPAPAD